VIASRFISNPNRGVSRSFCELEYQEQNRLQQTTDAEIRKSIQTVLKGMKSQVKTMDERMAPLVATRFNPTIEAFYQRLLAKGKLKKVALTVAMRKLFIILNTLVRTDQLWRRSVWPSSVNTPWPCNHQRLHTGSHLMRYSPLSWSSNRNNAPNKRTQWSSIPFRARQPVDAFRPRNPFCVRCNESLRNVASITASRSL